MARVPLYRDEAIVLRTHKLGEADRIITLLTRQHGRVRAVAKGVRRTTSRFGSRLEPFTHVDLQLAEGRSLDVITQAETLDAVRRAARRDYDRYTAGTVMLETAERLVTEEKEPVAPAVPAARRRAAGDGRRASTAAEQVLDSYLLRSLAVAGYAPSFDHCVPLRRRGPAPLVQPVGRRRAVRALPAARVGHPAGRDGRCCSARCSPATGRSSHAADPRHLREASGLVAAYLPGTSSAACARWRTSSAERPASGHSAVGCRRPRGPTRGHSTATAGAGRRSDVVGCRP